MSDEDIRISITLDLDLHERLKKMPYGIRSEVIRVLIRRVLDAGEKGGSAVYGAVLDGDFDIVPRKKKR